MDVVEARSRGGCAACVAGALVGFLTATQAHAVGTSAGTAIDNQAVAVYEIGGAVQPAVSSNLARINVDEILDTNVVWSDAAPVAVTSPMTGSVLTFTVTNTGNGPEALRFVAESALAGDDFDPANAAIYLESNGTPGLQTGSGGDTLYLTGGEPILSADGILTVYVTADVGSGFAPGAIGQLGLRAIANTVFVGAGTDDPANPAFPAPGVSYPGVGEAGVDAVVGASHTPGALTLRAVGSLRVSAAVVAIDKSVVSISDPFGGSTVVPGAIVRYALAVTVSGSGTVDVLTVTDALPAELEYVPGSLTATQLAAGNDLDDDRLPAGVDNTGFDSPSATVRFDLGSVPGGAAPITLGFDARVR